MTIIKPDQILSSVADHPTPRDYAYACVGVMFDYSHGDDALTTLQDLAAAADADVNADDYLTALADVLKDRGLMPTGCRLRWFECDLIVDSSLTFHEFRESRRLKVAEQVDVDDGAADQGGQVLIVYGDCPHRGYLGAIKQTHVTTLALHIGSAEYVGDWSDLLRFEKFLYAFHCSPDA